MSGSDEEQEQEQPSPFFGDYQASYVGSEGFKLIHPDGEKNYSLSHMHTPQRVLEIYIRRLVESEIKPHLSNLDSFSTDKYEVIFTPCNKVPDMRKTAEKYSVVVILRPFFANFEGKVKLYDYNMGVRRERTCLKSQITSMFGSAKLINEEGKKVSAVSWFLNSNWILLLQDFQRAQQPDARILAQLNPDPNIQARASVSWLGKFLLENGENPDLCEENETAFCLLDGGFEVPGLCYLRWLRIRAPNTDELQKYEDCRNRDIAKTRRGEDNKWGSLKSTYGRALLCTLGGNWVARKEIHTQIQVPCPVLFLLFDEHLAYQTESPSLHCVCVCVCVCVLAG